MVSWASIYGILIINNQKSIEKFQMFLIWNSLLKKYNSKKLPTFFDVKLSPPIHTNKVKIFVTIDLLCFNTFNGKFQIFRKFFSVFHFETLVYFSFCQLNISDRFAVSFLLLRRQTRKIVSYSSKICHFVVTMSQCLLEFK